MSYRTKRAATTALSMLAPNFLGFLVFTAGPVIFSLIMAFSNWDLTQHNDVSGVLPKFVGIENFQALINGEESQYFYRNLYNTVYMMLGIPVGIALSLIAAIMLSGQVDTANTKSGRRNVAIAVAITLATFILMMLVGIPPVAIFFTMVTGIIVILGLLFGQSAFRTLFYLPSLTAGVAVYIMWKAMYRPEGGPINNFFVQPFLNSLTHMVKATPDALWVVIGWTIAVAGIALVIWTLISEIRLLRDKDATPIGFALTMIAIGFIGWLFYLLGTGSVAHLPQAVQSADGLQAPKWLTSMEWSKPAIVIMGTFMAIGSNNMLLYLAALSNVPQSLSEAASIDGASKWQTFWNVTWPQLAPTTFFIVIMSTIGGLQGGFDMAKVMTNGGPAGSTTTLAYYVYERGFMDFRLGLASAISWVMFVMIFILTIINWKFGNKMVND